MLNSKIFKFSFTLLSVLLWCYLILRAIYNPLVFDEATSFFAYIQSGNFWPGKAYWSANNHFLNSALSHLSYSLFGTQEWALRLPNLLAFPFAAWYGFRLMRNLENAFLAWTALVLFFSSHYLFEFFAYSRGYGLMLTSILASLFYLGELKKQFKNATYWAFILAISLGLLSNISWLPLATYLLIGGLFLLWQSSAKKWILSIISLLPIIYAVSMSFALREHGQLYYGGQNGFIQDSLSSLTMSMLGEGYSIDILLAAGVLFSLSLALKFRKPKSLNLQGSALFLSLGFLLCTFFYPLGNLLLGLNFPFDRALIYWFAFGLIAFIALLNSLEKEGLRGSRFFMVWAVVFPLSLFSKLSLQEASFYGWAKEQIPQEFYHHLEAQEIQSVGGSYLLAPQWNFYQVKFAGSVPAYQKTSEPQNQFYLSSESPADSSYNEIYSIRPRTLRLFFKDALNGKPQLLKAFADTTIFEGLALYTFQADSLPDAFEFHTRIKFEEPVQKVYLGYMTYNSQEEVQAFQSIELSQYIGRSTEWEEWPVFVALDELKKAGLGLKVFILNPNSESFKLESTTFKALSKTEK